MLAIAEQMDRCGFESMEFFGFAGYIKMVREHKENPWDWIGTGAKKFRRTRLRYHGGLATGFEKIPGSVRLLMIERVVAHGITLTRSSDPWNDYEAAASEIKALRKLGMDVVINIIYSVSPRHTDAYYAERARQAAAIQPHRICFKDVGGLLTPERTRAVIGGPGVSDEELVLRVIAGEAVVKAMLATGAPKEYSTATQPLINLISELTQRRDCNRVFIQKGKLVLHIERRRRS